MKITESDQYLNADRKGKGKLIGIQKGLERAKSILLILDVPSTYLAILGKMKRSWYYYEHSATDYSINFPRFGQNSRVRNRLLLVEVNIPYCW